MSDYTWRPLRPDHSRPAMAAGAGMGCMFWVGVLAALAAGWLLASGLP